MPINSNHNMNLFIMSFVSLGVGAYLYGKYREKEELKLEFTSENDIIRKAFINETQLNKATKPILWIHIPYSKNARIWDDFYSRSTDNLNLPFMYLTIKSIIDQNASDFHVCLIDDDSFNKLIPKWSVDMEHIEYTAKNKYRTLGMLKLVEHYGGLVVPSSFVCMKSLKPLASSVSMSGAPFFFETYAKYQNNSSEITNEKTPMLQFFGAPKNDEVFRKVAYMMETMILDDDTDEMNMTEQFQNYVKSLVRTKEIYLFDGKYIGQKNDKMEPIMMEDLLNESTDCNIHEEYYGIHIPFEAIMLRHKYMWFTSETIGGILSGNYLLADYMKVAFNF